MGLEENKKEQLTRQQILQYAKGDLSNSYLDEIIKTTRNRLYNKYSKEEFEAWLLSPEMYETKLRSLVEYMYNTSGEFQRVVNYIPNASVIAPVLIANNNKYKSTKRNKKDDFISGLEYLEKSNILNNSKEVISTVFKEGIFFGLDIEGEYSSYIKKLNPDYCKIIGQNEKGLMIAYNFGYFDSNDFILESGYPKVFKELYNDYKKGIAPLRGLGLDAKWQIVPENLSLVIKFDKTNLNYSVPPFVTLYPQLIDLEEYKAINKARATSEAYNLLSVKVPLLNNDESDSFAVSNDVVNMVTSMIDSSIPDWMGWLLLPGLEPEMMSASTPTQSSSNKVEDATKSVFSSMGMASQLFGVDNVNSGTLNYSIQCDMQMLFGIYRQLESHYNYKIQKKFKGRLRLKFLDVHKFNMDDFLGYCKDSSTIGIPVLTLMNVILGISQLDALDLSEQQIDVFDILTKWIPPQSSYNSGDSEGEAGRPELDDGDLTESGEQTKNSETNQNSGN